MNHSHRISVSSLLAIAVVCASSRARADDVSDLSEALDATLEYVAHVQSQDEDVGLVSDGPSLLGSSLDAGDRANMGTYLRRGRTYVFIARSARGVDIDLQLTDADGDVVEEDRDHDGRPVMVYRPRRSGQYTLSLINASREHHYVAMAAMSDDHSTRMTLRYMASTLAPLVRDARRALRRRGAGFQEGGWSFLATILDDGETHSFNNIPTGRRSGRVYVRGDSDSEDLDLTVSDGRGRQLGRDDDHDAYPQVSFPAERSIDLGIHGYNVTRSSLVGALVILDGPGHAARSGRASPGRTTAAASPVLRVFVADWCSACKAQLRALDEADASRRLGLPGGGVARVRVIDVEAGTAEAEAMRGDSLPELQVVMNGRVKAVAAGARSVRELREWVRSEGGIRI